MFHPRDSLAEFFRLYGFEYGPRPLTLARKLIAEEYNEVLEAFDALERAAEGTYVIDELSELAKELADLIYVACFAARAYGVDIAPVLAAVHASNMTKVWDDGQIHRDENGKVLKPPNWVKPDIRSIITESVDDLAAAA